MICVNSFDQKVGELHVWGSNRRFDVITLTEELRKLDGRVIVSTKIISGSFTDCATIAKIPTMDRQLKVILTTSINISITINYYYLFTWHRQFGNVEGLDNTQSFADVFGDCQKSSALSHIIGQKLRHMLWFYILLIHGQRDKTNTEFNSKFCFFFCLFLFVYCSSLLDEKN